METTIETKHKTNKFKKPIITKKAIIQLVWASLLLILTFVGIGLVVGYYDNYKVVEFDKTFKPVYKLFKEDQKEYRTTIPIEKSFFAMGFVVIILLCLARITFTLLRMFSILSTEPLFSKKVTYDKTQKSSIGVKFARAIEKVGNKLPSPFYLFWYFVLFLLIIAFFLGIFQVNYEDRNKSGIPGSWPIVNVLGGQVFGNWLTNFFGPIASSQVTWIIIVMMLGVRLAEKTGFLNITILRFTRRIPSFLVIPTFVLLCVTSSIASDIGYLLLIPLGGLIWKSIGRHPIAGIATAFAGVSGGFGAALMFGPVDSIFFGYIKDIVKVSEYSDTLLWKQVDESYGPATHIYFLIGSTFFLTLVVSLISLFIVEPMLNKLYPISVQNVEGDKEFLEKLNAPLTVEQKKGLLASLIIFIAFTIFILINIFVPDGWLSKKDTFIKTFILTFTTMFLFMGLAYGIALKKFKTKKDVFKVFLEIAREQSGFILVLIGALTFINLFSQTGMAALISNFFTNITTKMNLNDQPLLLLIIFIFVVSILNLFMAGRITKVLMIGPMFIPTFLKLKVHPVIVGAALRIGDSPTNIITPLLVYLPMIIGFCHQYLKEEVHDKFQVGSIISIMLPFAIIMLISWAMFFGVWYSLKIPFGWHNDIYNEQNWLIGLDKLT